MLNGIKSLINQKKDFMEAADLILEESSIQQKLDDTIVLGEETEPEEDTPTNDEELPTTKPDDGTDNDNGEETPAELPVEEEPTNDNPEDTPTDGETPAEPTEPTEGDVPTGTEEPAVPEGGEEQPMELPGADDIPTAIGAQTGEPVNGDSDLLSTEIDLGSNTMKDVLPVPPGNAPEAVNDDILNQRIDSGFGDDNDGSTEPVLPSEENPLGSPTAPIPEETEDVPASSDPEGPTEADLQMEATLFEGLDNIDDDTKKELIKRIKCQHHKDMNHEGHDKECKGEGCPCGKDGEHKDESCKEESCNGTGCAEESGENTDDNSSDGNNEPESTSDNDGSTVMQEAITMSDDPDEGGDVPTDGVDVGNEGAPSDTPDDNGGDVGVGDEESPVTAAVKDKVAESEAPIEPEAGATGSDIKDDLMKKLTSMSKNMEDLKLKVSQLAQ